MMNRILVESYIIFPRGTDWLQKEKCKFTVQNSGRGHLNQLAEVNITSNKKYQVHVPSSVRH